MNIGKQRPLTMGKGEVKIQSDRYLPVVVVVENNNNGTPRRFGGYQRKLKFSFVS
jgi:hypothetical protein